MRRSALRSVGWLDEGGSPAGGCGVHSDYDAAMRLWLGGWQARAGQGAGWGGWAAGGAEGPGPRGHAHTHTHTDARTRTCTYTAMGRPCARPTACQARPLASLSRAVRPCPRPQVGYLSAPGLAKDPAEGGEGGTHRPAVQGLCWERCAGGRGRGGWGRPRCGAQQGARRAAPPRLPLAGSGRPPSATCASAGASTTAGTPSPTTGSAATWVGPAAPHKARATALRGQPGCCRRRRDPSRSGAAIPSRIATPLCLCPSSAPRQPWHPAPTAPRPAARPPSCLPVSVSGTPQVFELLAEHVRRLDARRLARLPDGLPEEAQAWSAAQRNQWVRTAPPGRCPFGTGCAAGEPVDHQTGVAGPLRPLPGRLGAWPPQLLAWWGQPAWRRG
jgi:hypothetical protein